MVEYSVENLMMADAGFWADQNKIKLSAGEFTFFGHEHQIEVLRDNSRRQCFRKATQVTGTEGYILKTLHGLIHNKWPQGVLYMFPTGDDVSAFSSRRFGPLIAENPETIGKYIGETNQTTIKKIGKAHLIFRGARLSTSIEGEMKSTAKLKSDPVDGFIADEVDEMDQNAIDMAKGRYAHSRIKFEWYLGNPTVPNYGIDALYLQSDQRVWMIPCRGCGKETCLELEFPECLYRMKDGSVVRLCMHCRRKSLNPRDGHWVALYPDKSKDLVGRWISHLSSIFINPKDILDEWESPNLKKQLFYNLKLGMGYIATENQLSRNDIFDRCGMEPMLSNHPGPCAMGVDVQGERKGFHVVIGYKVSGSSYHICKMARVSNLNDLDDLRRRFHVKEIVCDIEPETRLMKEYANSVEKCEVFLCDYKESQKRNPAFNSVDHMVSINRTEICDETHEFIVGDKLHCTLPRRCSEVEEYATQMHNIGKILEDDKKTGNKFYFYKHFGVCDYYHATNYFLLAIDRVGISKHEEQKSNPRDKWGSAFEDDSKPGSFMGV